MPSGQKGAQCGRIVIPRYETDTRFAARMITMNAFFFTLLIFDDEEFPPDEVRVLAKNTLEAMSGIEAWPA